MRVPSLIAVLALLLTGALCPAFVWAAELKPTLLGTYRDWHVYAVGAARTRFCYALSQPKKSTPSNLKRDSTYFLISTWPAQKKRNEPSIVAGYTYKSLSKAVVQVGADKFDFALTKDDGAWMEAAPDEKSLIDAMKRGAAMSVTGTSSRGNLTRDEYSLSGLSVALDKIDMSCK